MTAKIKDRRPIDTRERVTRLRDGRRGRLIRDLIDGSFLVEWDSLPSQGRDVGRVTGREIGRAERKEE